MKGGILLLFLATVLSSRAQEYKADAKLDTATMLIGDQVGLTLSFSFPENTMVRWPMIGDTILGNILVLNWSKIDTLHPAGQKTTTLSQKFLLTCFDSGFYTIPPVRFFYRTQSDTSTLTAQTGMILLNVHTVPVDTSQAIKPIKGPVNIPLTFREMLPWILGGLLLAALIFALVYYLRKRKKSEPVFVLKPKIVISPHEAALAALERLRMQKLWQTGRVKEFHTELTEILRRYIEERFGLPALERTTAEIVGDLETHGGTNPATREKLRRVLERADLVKFAKAQPLPAEHEASLDDGVAFIQETIPATEHKPEPNRI